MTFKEFINYIINTLITPFFSILLGAAVVFFLWNMLGVYKNNDNPEELAKMKSQAMWGIIAIAVMISMWGLVTFVTGSLQLKTSERINLDRFERPL